MNRTPAIMIEAENKTLVNNLLVITGAFFGRGGRFMTVLLTGSTPSD